MSSSDSNGDESPLPESPESPPPESPEYSIGDESPLPESPESPPPESPEYSNGDESPLPESPESPPPESPEYSIGDESPLPESPESPPPESPEYSLPSPPSEDQHVIVLEFLAALNQAGASLNNSSEGNAAVTGDSLDALDGSAYSPTSARSESPPGTPKENICHIEIVRNDGEGDSNSDTTTSADQDDEKRTRKCREVRDLSPISKAFSHDKLRFESNPHLLKRAQEALDFRDLLYESKKSGNPIVLPDEEVVEGRTELEDDEEVLCRVRIERLAELAMQVRISRGLEPFFPGAVDRAWTTKEGESREYLAKCLEIAEKAAIKSVNIAKTASLLKKHQYIAKTVESAKMIKFVKKAAELSKLELIEMQKQADEAKKDAEKKERYASYYMHEHTLRFPSPQSVQAALAFQKKWQQNHKAAAAKKPNNRNDKRTK